jgi:hypothetical protein
MAQEEAIEGETSPVFTSMLAFPMPDDAEVD